MTESALELYQGGDDTKVLYERAATHYLELYNATGKPPRLEAVVDSLLESHPDIYPSRELVVKRLTTPEFQEELRIRRKENLIANIGPRLLMAEMAASIAKEALDETLYRLQDDDRRASISNRDLNTVLKTASELALAVDRDVEEVAQVAPVNKGTIVQLFTQLSPERAAVVMQELARQATAKEREGE